MPRSGLPLLWSYLAYNRGRLTPNAVDDFRAGYPRYTALLSSHNSFQVFRRFTRARTRLLLEKQFEITLLEKELDETDVKEPNPLLLCCLQRDDSEKRRTALRNLKAELAEYDELLQQHQRWLRSPTASKHDVKNLKNWLDGNACIADPEADYLACADDVFSLDGFQDSEVTRIENALTICFAWIHHQIAKAFCGLRLCQPKSITDDEDVFIYGPMITACSRAAMSVIATIILVTPIIALDFIANNAIRLVVIILASGAFVLAVSTLAKARTVETLAAGAAYAAVVVSFTASNTSAQYGSCRCDG